ncbi:hypothetical protein BGZ63DRAFT_468906 [Mariannaea sp. PMI_226]|nr:hypothetical protein BGZ63DRAFT_468906 [Mariannaea sp. PMI_226]
MARISVESSFSDSISSVSSSPLLFHHAEAAVDSNRMEHELDIIKTWFAILNDEERTSALTSIAELPCLREIEPMIQTLKDRKRELWRRQEDLLVQPASRSKWVMPVFPRNTEDPKWVTKWLRALRLHKYEKCLTGMTPFQVSRLSDAELQELGVDTVGARGKLLRAQALSNRAAQAPLNITFKLAF